MAKKVSLRLARHYGVDMTHKDRQHHFASLSGMMHRKASDALLRAVGYRRLCTLPAPIHSMISVGDGSTLLIHAGKRLYTMNTESVPALPTVREALERKRSASPAKALRISGKTAEGASTSLYDFLPNRRIPHAVLGNSVYLLTGTHVLVYTQGALSVIADETNPMTIGGVTVTDTVTPYVPLLLSNGSVCEQRNLLTDLYRVEAELSLGESNDRSGPFTYERTGEDDARVPTCRVTSYTGEGPLSFLAIPESAVVDGVHCAVTDIAPGALENSGVRSLALPASMKALAPTGPLLGIEDLRSLYLPYGVFMLTRQALLYAPEHLRIFYAGTKEEWEEVTLVPSDGSFAPQVDYESGTPYRALTVDLPRDGRTLECLSFTLNGEAHKSSALDVAYSFLSDGEGGIRAVYLLVASNLSLAGMNIGMLLRGAPYAYRDGEGGAGHPLLRGSVAETDARALVMSAEVMASHDDRLFFGAPSGARDALFYTHTDSSGRPNVHYLASENFSTAITSGGISGIFGCEGDLLVLRTDGAMVGATLSAYEGVTPDAATALFRRVYVAAREASLPHVRYAFLFGGRLHLLTDDGLFRATRATSGGYFSFTHVSSRIDPLLLSGKGGFQHASLEGLLLLSSDAGALIGDHLRKEDGEYEWYPLGALHDFKGDSVRFVSMTELPFGEDYTHVMMPSGGIAALKIPEAQVERDAFHIEFLPLCTASGTPHPENVTVSCTLGTQCYLPMSTDGIFTGGNACEMSALCSVRDLTLLGSSGGGVFLFNTDTDGEREECYRADGHETVAHVQTFPFDAGTLHEKKRTVRKTAYLTVGDYAKGVRVSVIKDGVPSAMAQRLGDCCLDFASLDFTQLAFSHLHPRPIPLYEDARDYYEKSYRIESASLLSFRELGFTAEVRERGKIL